MSNESKALVKVQTESGEIALSSDIVKRYLVNGNGAVTEQEIMMFMALCKAQNLNPFIREAYLIKYGSQPATIVTSKEAFLKRAMRLNECRGFKAGVICQCKESKEIMKTEGFCPPGCEVVGGWAEVQKDAWAYPHRVEVSLNEYMGRKGDGTPNKMWTEKPATMIRKVALVQALREAFPTALGGMYSTEEINTVDAAALPTIPVAQAPEVVEVQVTEPQPAAEDKQTRRRTKKFAVDEKVFGSSEIQTCGATPEQLLEIKKIIIGADSASRSKVKDFMTGIGYQETSFLRFDEAEQLLEAVFWNEPGEAQEAPPLDPGMPTDLIECDIRGGDKMSISQYCHVSCPDRKSSGFCPILGEEAAGGLI